MSNPIYDYITSAAVSLTMAGNTGISPFLTLLVLGIIEMFKPELLNMGGTMEMLLSSWWSIAVLGILSIAEMIGKCIPAVDEVIDSAEVFVVPAISILATLATMGMFPVSEQDDAGQGQKINPIDIFNNDGDGYRLLEEDIDDPNGFGKGFMTFTMIVLVIAGIGLSLAIHVFKMLVRVSSLMCSGGCCQPCITITEYIMVIFGVILAIMAPIFAVVACLVFIIAAGYVISVKCCKKKEADEDVSNGKKKDRKSKNSTEDDHCNNHATAIYGDDLEKQGELGNNHDTNLKTPPPETFVVADLVDVPLSSNMPLEKDVEATVY